MISCKNCGCVNLDVSRFCRNCAASLEGAAPVITEERAVTEQRAEPLLQKEELPSDGQDELSIPGESEAAEGTVTVLFDEEGSTLPALFGDEPEPPAPVADGFIDFDAGEAEESEPVKAEPIEKLREVALSPLFTVFAILATGGFVLTVLNMLKGLVFSGDFLDLSSAYSDAVSAMTIMGLSLYNSLNMAPMASVIISGVRVLCVLPSALYFIGIWMSYSGAVGRRKNTLAGGLSFMGAGAFLSLAGYGLSLLACVLVGGLMLAFASDGNAAALIAIALMTLISVLGILYCFFLSDTLSRLKSTVREGFVDYRTSILVVVVNMLCAILQSSVGGFCLAGFDLVGGILAFVNMLSLVLMGFLLLRIRALSNV